MERITRSILLIRTQKVMLDADLAALYGVETRVLVQAVKRNRDRFPPDFMFQLTKPEFDKLRSQVVTSSRYPPYAFTEQGVSMLSSVLRSKRAILTNIEIMRANMTPRFKVVFDAIQELISAPEPESTRPIGFAPESDDHGRHEPQTPDSQE